MTGAFSGVPGPVGSAGPVGRVGRGRPCPCGSGQPYDVCCGPLHEGAPAPTAEAVMRSRYSAFVAGDENHLLRTWHPRTRPESVRPDPRHRWTGLEVLRSDKGGPDDDTGIVEYRASFRNAAGATGALHETARFERRGRRWVYVDGDIA